MFYYLENNKKYGKMVLINSVNYKFLVQNAYEERQGSKMRLRTRLMIMALLPVIGLGVLTYLVASAQIRQGMEDQLFDGMQSTIRTVRALFDSRGEGEYYLDETGQMWKGEGINISAATELVDSIKEETGFEVTVFYGDERILTTLKDAGGNRQIGTKASADISSLVLDKSQDYQSSNTEIFGKRYMCYYVPLYQTGTQTPVGMVFIGKEYANIEAVIQKVLVNMLLIILAVFFIVSITSILSANSIALAIKKAILCVDQMSKGQLGIKVPKKLMERKDEIGDMCRGVKGLDDNLTSVVTEIQLQSHALEETVIVCNKNAHKVFESAEQINAAAEEVAAATSTQAQGAVEAESSVNIIGRIIDETNERMQEFSDTSLIMAKASESAKDTLAELNASMNQVKTAVDNVHHQTNETHVSVEKISEMTAVITSIASQTNMLSLNASIEAARAGEMGRGFAVVAEQIRKLAEECNSSAVEIREVHTQLKNNSDESVNTMEEVQGIIQVQADKLTETNQVFDTVEKGIDKSLKGIDKIIEEINSLNDSRNSATREVQNVAVLAQQNAASIEETSASIDEVTALLQGMTQKIDGLSQVAYKLEEKAEVFQIRKEG